MSIAGSIFYPFSYRPRPRTRPRRRFAFFNSEDEDQDDWAPLNLLTKIKFHISTASGLKNGQ